MTPSLRHVGLVVRNIDKSIQFYRDIIGLMLLQRTVEEGEFIENVVGVKDVKLEWAKLATSNGLVVELLQYHSHPDSSKEEINYPSYRHGCSHIALAVEDIDAHYSLLMENGVHCNSKPALSPNGKAKVLYCHDVDGIIIELVEEIKR